MPVSVSCYVCGKRIRDVPPTEFRNLTGYEACKQCDDKITACLADMERIKKDYESNINKLYERAKKIYESLDKAQQKYNNDAMSLYRTMKAEFESFKENILNS